MKRILDLRITAVERTSQTSVLLRAAAAEGALPECRPGQFAQLSVEERGTLLRRPISIHEARDGEILFLVQEVGRGSRWLARRRAGDVVNAVLPLGHGFTCQGLGRGERVLLVGGGVGVAPLLMLGRWWREQGVEPTYLLGGRSKDHLLRLDAFREVGRVEVTTEDGSLGERGFVTDHSLLRQEEFSLIQTCGPTPMMKSVARYARQRGVPCEVSLENHMACGVGACLCCVTADREGHNRCVCTEGPVFPAELIMND